MSYPAFCVILFGNLAVSVLLLALKLFSRAEFSWFAVPFPILLGVAIVSIHYVWMVLIWRKTK